MARVHCLTIVLHHDRGCASARQFLAGPSCQGGDDRRLTRSAAHPGPDFVGAEQFVPEEHDAAQPFWTNQARPRPGGRSRIDPGAAAKSGATPEIGWVVRECFDAFMFVHEGKEAYDADALLRNVLCFLLLLPNDAIRDHHSWWNRRKLQTSFLEHNR